jgi:hypothetical protein
MNKVEEVAAALRGKWDEIGQTIFPLDKETSDLLARAAIEALSQPSDDEESYVVAHVLRWYRARKAFLSGATVKDATTKLPTLNNPGLLTELADAENALAKVGAYLE